MEDEGDLHPKSKRAAVAETRYDSQVLQRCLGGTKRRLRLKGYSAEPGKGRMGRAHGKYFG